MDATSRKPSMSPKYQTTKSPWQFATMYTGAGLDPLRTQQPIDAWATHGVKASQPCPPLLPGCHILHAQGQTRTRRRR
jgi:hypothetical protein